MHGAFPVLFIHSKPDRDTLLDYGRRIDFIKGVIHAAKLVRFVPTLKYIINKYIK
jgi:hypothetical protein